MGPARFKHCEWAFEKHPWSRVTLHPDLHLSPRSCTVQRKGTFCQHDLITPTVRGITVFRYMRGTFSFRLPLQCATSCPDSLIEKKSFLAKSDGTGSTCCSIASSFGSITNLELALTLTDKHGKSCLAYHGSKGSQSAGSK